MTPNTVGDPLETRLRLRARLRPYADAAISTIWRFAEVADEFAPEAAPELRLQCTKVVDVIEATASGARGSLVAFRTAGYDTALHPVPLAVLEELYLMLVTFRRVAMNDSTWLGSLGDADGCVALAPAVFAIDGWFAWLEPRAPFHRPIRMFVPVPTDAESDDDEDARAAAAGEESRTRQGPYPSRKS